MTDELDSPLDARAFARLEEASARLRTLRELSPGLDDTLVAAIESLLRESEDRFGRFMHHLPGLAWIKDDQGRYVYANDTALQAFQKTRDQLYGKTDQEVFPPEVAARFAENDTRARKSGAGIQIIETLEHADGMVHHSIVSKFPVHGPDQKSMVGGVAIDITERKLAEDALLTSEEKFRELARRQNLLLEATSHLIERIETTDLVSSLLEVSGEIVAADAFGLWRRNDDDVWSVASSKGLSDAFITETLLGDTSIELFTDPVLVQPADLEDRSNPLLRDRWHRYSIEGIRSLMILPLRIHGEISGALVFYCRSNHVFTEIEIESAQALANIAAAAITTSELYETQSQMRRRAEEDAVRDSFLAAAGAILSESLDFEKTLANIARAAVPKFADWCAVDLFDDAGVLRRLAIAHVDPRKIEMARELHERYSPEAFPNVGIMHVIRTGRADLVSEITDDHIVRVARTDVQYRLLRELQLTSYICVPLRVGERTLGAITFATAESKRRFGEQDLEVALEIARRAAQAMDNARLYRDLHQSEERYRAVVESQLEMVCRFRPDGTILFVNGAYARAQDRSPQDLIGTSLWELVSESDHQYVHDMLDQLNPGKDKIAIENRLETSTGVRWTLWTNHALDFDERGYPTELQATGIDITKRKEAEEALSRARDELEIRVAQRTEELRSRAEQLGRLASELTLTEQRERQRLAHILHDHLQQLLVGAKLRLSSLARSSSEKNAEQFSDVDNLIDEALKASRSLTVELAPPILHEAGLGPGLLWLSRWMNEKHGLTINITIDERAATDREDLRILFFQAARELLFNVVKHAGVAEASLDFALLENDCLQLVVSDRGRGFDVAALNKRDGRQQAGFGLFSIRERISLLGGRLEIQTAKDRGSRFALLAPVETVRHDGLVAREFASATGAPAAQPKYRSDANGSEIRVLLVDDHDVIRQGIATLLSDEPQITIVGEATNGVQAIVQAHALGPDVILMDFSLPYMDGVEATRRIKAELPDIKIIGLSIYEQPERAAAMIRAGASAYHTKSGDANELIESIRGVARLSR